MPNGRPLTGDPRVAEEGEEEGWATMTTHAIAKHAEWLDARKKLLAREKEFTRLREELSQARRDLPWERVEKEYTFEGPRGKATLDDLFAGRSQLVVYHFMFGADWKAGCPHCSFWADNFDRIVVHLEQRDVTMVAVSRAPYAKLAEYEKRMGWSFDWYSSGETSFNFDFGASFDVRARHRHDEHRVPLPRSRPEGPRRGRARAVLGQEARRVREVTRPLQPKVEPSWPQRLAGTSVHTT
jgi:predicted dithiol-disulfide oxidoreductase (DUF899 family)